MPTLINDRALERRLIRHRRRTGADRYDEVWEGTYVMVPIADNQHQYLSLDLGTIFNLQIDQMRLGRTALGVNVSDREDDWRENFRVPDLAVFLNDTAAIEHQNYWYGGPDFALEIVSKNDRTDEKIPFYEKVGTRELLIIDRNPWKLRLYRLTGGRLQLHAESTAETSTELRSDLVPLTFRLEAQDGKPVIQIAHHDARQSWTIAPRELPPPRPRKKRDPKHGPE